MLPSGAVAKSSTRHQQYLTQKNMLLTDLCIKYTLIFVFSRELTNLDIFKSLHTYQCIHSNIKNNMTIHGKY